MKRSKITVAVGVLLGGLAAVCGGRAAARQEAAARANAQQVQELLAAARDLDLPVGIELEAVQICHQPVTSDCWQTYVFDGDYRWLLCITHEDNLCLLVKK